MGIYCILLFNLLVHASLQFGKNVRQFHKFFGNFKISLFFSRGLLSKLSSQFLEVVRLLINLSVLNWLMLIDVHGFGLRVGKAPCTEVPHQLVPHF